MKSEDDPCQGEWMHNGAASGTAGDQNVTIVDFEHAELPEELASPRARKNQVVPLHLRSASSQAASG
jgi:hypothetical protein